MEVNQEWCSSAISDGGHRSIFPVMRHASLLSGWLAWGYQFTSLTHLYIWETEGMMWETFGRMCPIFNDLVSVAAFRKLPISRVELPGVYYSCSLR